jgi:cellulose biosynthesis protein BcsQ
MYPQVAPPAAAEPGRTEVTSEWLRRDIAAASNVIVIMMRKGGAGKTTMTLLLADALARFGLSVLVVDMDPQGNSSIGLGKHVELVEVGRTRIGDRPILEPTELTVCEVIDSGEPGVADEAIAMVDWGYDPAAAFERGGPLFPGQVGAIGVIPCYKKLESDVPRWTTPKDLERLGSALLLSGQNGVAAPHRRWDVVLIDTPPGGSLISVQAAKAAFWALLVAPPASFAAAAVPETMELLLDIKDGYDHDELDILGLVINDLVTQTRLTQRNILGQLDERHRGGERLFRAPIWPVTVPRYTVVQDSQAANAPVSAFLADRASRETARRVCQAAEANALHMLHAISHPQAARIQRAWAAAWPSHVRPEFITET